MNPVTFDIRNGIRKGATRRRGGEGTILRRHGKDKTELAIVSADARE